jgi:hypothetical protein
MNEWMNERMNVQHVSVILTGLIRRKYKVCETRNLTYNTLLINQLKSQPQKYTKCGTIIMWYITIYFLATMSVTRHTRAHTHTTHTHTHTRPTQHSKNVPVTCYAHNFLLSAVIFHLLNKYIVRPTLIFLSNLLDTWKHEIHVHNTWPIYLHLTANGLRPISG